MKCIARIIKITTVTIVFILCGLATNTIASDFPAELVLHTQYEFPPYVIQNQDQTLGGHSIAVVQCIAQRLNLPLTLNAYPWPRAQQLVQAGSGDGFFPASRNHWRDSFSSLSEPVSPQRWYWYLPVTSTANSKSQDFHDHAPVGARLGSNMYNWLKKNNYNLTYYTSNWETLVTALVNNRVEAILANDATTDPILAELQLTPEYRKELCLDMPLGVYFSHQFLTRYPAFLKQFNAQIPACQRSLAEFQDHR